MKKRVVSILIAGVLFFSNIGVTSFAANNSAAESSSVASTEASSVAEEKENENAYGEEGNSYYKITDFTDLPENISNQKVRVGGSLEDLELPDTLEVAVEADYEHDERIERGLAQERERLKREQADQEERAKKGSSEDESDAAASEDSGEEIIFFDENGEEIAPSDASSELSDEDTYEEELYSGDTSTIEDEEAPTIDTPVEEDTNSDAGSSEEVIDVTEEDTTESGAEESTEATSEESLVSWFKNTFRIPAVTYAADAKEIRAQKEGVSIEQISDVEWILEPEYNNGVEEFVADKEGAIYLFTPVLLIPDTYYVEDELPIITVTVTDDFYAFDEKAVVDDVTIRVRADKGVFPEGARVTAKKLAAEDEEKVKEVVDEQLESENVVKEYTFDITIKDKEGYEVQPDTEKGRVVVSFETAEVADETLEAEIYHIIDEKEVEEEPKEVETVALGGEREKERVLTIYDENSVLKAEKLEAEVVEFEDVKVLEAATDSFSSYKVIFKNVENAKEYPLENANIVKVKDILDAVITSFSGDIENVRLSTDSADYLFADRLGSTSVDGNGVYTSSDTGVWYLIVKRPFDGAKAIYIDYKDGTEDKTVVIDVTNDMEIDPTVMLNDYYPTATSLTTTKFILKIPVYKEYDSLGNPIKQVILYQWQKSEDNLKWKDIDLANSEIYGTTDPTRMWYRCCVNGKYSEAVQIITKDNDKGRTWTAYYGDSSQRYVSNGIMAYTIAGKNKLDVIGEFTVDGKKYMLQTTFGGRGWTLYNDETPLQSSYDEDVYSRIQPGKDLFFSFDENTMALRVAAYLDLANEYDNFAIITSSAIGENEKNTALATVSGSDLTKLAIVGAKDKDVIQNAINIGSGNSIPSLLITPKTHEGLIYHIGDTGTQKAYKEGTETYVKETMPGTSISWKSVTDGVVKFEFRLAGAATNNILTPVSKRATANTYSSGNIKSVKLSGSELDSFAKSLGKPTETILIEMKNGSASSADRTAITNILPTYNKVTTTSTPNAASAGSTSTGLSTATKYTADYYGVTFTYTKAGVKTTDEDGFYKDKAELPVVLKEEISYDFNEKEDVRVFRCHDGEAKELRTDNVGADGTYKLDKDAGKIYIYASNFSSFAVAYKPEVYYTVTFNDGTKTWTSKVKAGEKVSAPEGMPTKNGVTAQYWYKGTSSSSTSSSTSTTKPAAYDFNTPVTANMTLVAYYGTTHKVTFSGISPSVIVEVADGEKVARPTDPVKEGYTFKGWYSDKTAKTLYNFDTPVTKDLTLYAGFVNGEGKDADDEEEDGDVNGARAARTNDTLPPVWLWVLILVSALVVFSCNLYSRAKEGKVKFSNNKTVRKVTRFFLLVGLVIVTVFKFLARKVNEKRRDLALAVSGVVVLIAAGVLIVTSLEYHRSERTYEKANKTFVQETQQLPVVTDKTETVNAENTVWWDEASVEMDTLSEEYPDVIGWIYFENEDISYPIMYSGDNTKYLSTSYNGEKAKAGAIFLDGESTPDFSDPHSLIYGHNMRDLSMFGKLRYYKTDASYYDEHQYFQVFTKDGVYRYQIFAYEEVPDNHDVFWVYGKNPEGMWEMLQDIEGGSYRQTGIEATESDHVITLATCTSKEDRRLIVSAVRTDEHDYEYVASN